MNKKIPAVVFIFFVFLTGHGIAQTFVVNTNTDASDVTPGDGVCDIDEGTAGSQCSLRAAILEANVSPGKDTISFNIPGMMSRRIVLLSPLDEIVDPVILNGTDQPGFDGSPQIELDGSLSDPYSPSGVSGLVVSCGDSEIRGLVINRVGIGIVLKDNGHNVIETNYIGVDTDGISATGICTTGIQIIDSPGNRIGGTGPNAGNVISGISPYGILIQGVDSVNNKIQGNIIGASSDGLAFIGNPPVSYTVGVSIMGPASQNLIGGSEPDSGNLISGNTYGIIIQQSLSLKSWGNTICGNLIGTDITGMLPLGNSYGLFLGNSYANLVGGTDPGAKNVISGNKNNGIHIQGAGAENNDIQGNYIGIDMTGMAALPNGRQGIAILEGNNRVGGPGTGAGNVISGNLESGVRIESLSADGNQVRGNLIGTDSSGEHPIPNSNGIQITNAQDNTIGGAEVGSGNLISGNTGPGISLGGINTTGNSILGNCIGTDRAGAHPLPNSSGIDLGTGSHHNTVGSNIEGGRNVISGNRFNGISVDSGSNSNIIQSNYIGTDMTGLVGLGNMAHGIAVDNAEDTLIGGDEAGQGNVISFNGFSGSKFSGVVIFGADARANKVQGNLIGTDRTGKSPLGNGGDGILIGDGAGDTLVGGPFSEAANIIAHNYGCGILMDSGISNAVLSNRIFSNIGPGIELGNDFGPTPNDLGDEDEGANHLQNFPEIQSVIGNDIHGTINTSSLSDILIQCYVNTACYFSGYGQGETFVGQTTTTTDVNGNADFTITADITLAPGLVVTATATLEKNTSEFSSCFKIPGAFPDADLDHDQDVDGRDMVILASNFNRTDCSAQIPCSGDLDQNLSVDSEDLRLFCLALAR